MKAKQVEVSTDELLDKLNKLNSQNRYDTHTLKIVTGKSGLPHKNQKRVVGNFETVRTHYLPNSQEKDDLRKKNLPFYVVCIGRPNCPVCAVSDALNDDSAGATKQTKETAKKYYSIEANYWNVIPRWEYDFGGDGRRFLALKFGVKARRTLEEIVQTYKHPGSFSNGFDLNYIAGEGTGNFGGEYKFGAVLEKVADGNSVTHKLNYAPLTAEEGEMEMIDLDTYTKPPTNEQLEALSILFDVDALLGRKNTKTRRAEPDKEVDKPKEEETDLSDVENSKPVCFGHVDVYDPDDSECNADCKFFKECGDTIKKEGK